MKRAHRHALELTLSIFAAAAAGCQMGDPSSSDQDADSISSALEQENGGLDMTDEAPYFGDQPLFDDAGVDVESVYEDSMAQDADVDAMADAPDAVAYQTTILWGQIPPNPEAENPRQWDGTLTVNRGAMIVRSAIAFEGPTDRIVPRDDRRSVSFTSVTLPANDGLRLTLVDPEPLSDEPLTLTYSTRDGDMLSVAVAELVDGPVEREVDDQGNKVVATAMPRPVDACRHGFLGGRWHRVADGRGRILGRVVSAAGEPLGHIRGIYGRRQNGERVFFGKYINLAGEFQGLFAGHYGDGHFAGRWHTRSGDIGALGGRYRESLPGPEIGGHFIGRWAETSCNLPINDQP